MDIKTSINQTEAQYPADEHLVPAPHLSRALLKLAHVLCQLLDEQQIPIFCEEYPPNSAIPTWHFTGTDKKSWEIQVAARDLHESPRISVFLCELEPVTTQVKNGGIQIALNFTCSDQVVHVAEGSGTRKGVESDIELAAVALSEGLQIRRGREAGRVEVSQLRSILTFI